MLLFFLQLCIHQLQISMMMETNQAPSLPDSFRSPTASQPDHQFLDPTKQPPNYIPERKNRLQKVEKSFYITHKKKSKKKYLAFIYWRETSQMIGVQRRFRHRFFRKPRRSNNPNSQVLSVNLIWTCKTKNQSHPIKHPVCENSPQLNEPKKKRPQQLSSLIAYINVELVFTMLEDSTTLKQRMFLETIT